MDRDTHRRLIELSEDNTIFGALIEWYVVEQHHCNDLILDTPLMMKVKKWNTRKFVKKVKCLCGKEEFIGQFAMAENVFTKERCIVGQCCAQYLGSVYIKKISKQR